MKSFWNEEKGAVLVIVTAALMVIMGFTALAIDGGHLYVRHTRLQDIADAAALAAGMSLVDTSGHDSANALKDKAFMMAQDYVIKNGITLKTSYPSHFKADIVYQGEETGLMQVNFISDHPSDPPSKVRVDLTIQAKNAFASVFGISETPVSTSATALVGSVGTNSGGTFPVGIVDAGNPGLEDDFVTGTVYELTLGPGGGLQGNYGWLNLGAPSDFDNIIENGYDQPLSVDQSIETRTGVTIGNVYQAIIDRVSKCTGTTDGFSTVGLSDAEIVSGIQQHLEVDTNCPRLIYTPVIESYGGSGSSTTQIKGFAAFFIIAYEHDASNVALKGVFIEELDAEKIEPTATGTVQAVKLVQ